ncbi:hypothetical protein B0F90DRAFT_1632351 [Multifurca ochricompacta]|uniref:Uncharacterized protein n=1 Tax=Multifurca ochricompacta TaxID=376703 RepID=A0AAD4QMI7_9AGAM|nr:hypothetical protein B0F90DRAFT_1632351 [Multifurca ochricompacta]
MKALREIPYPSTSPDPSIFESWSNEYDNVRLPRPSLRRRSIGKTSSLRRTSHHHDASSLLENLSLSGKFAEAQEVREELLEMNIHIRPSLAYSHAAWHVLRQRPWRTNRSEVFASWLSLLPNMADTEKVPQFNELKTALLFNTSTLDLDSIAQFGLVLSSKGYIRSMGATVVACLTRYAHPDVNVTADDDYKRKKLGLTRDAETRYKHTSKRLWSIAVRTHCTAGRPELAFQMAKRAHERGFNLTQYTYQYLLGKLEADSLKELSEEVRAFPGCGSLDVAKSRLIIQSISLVLAILKRSSQSGVPANAASIVPYFDIYKTDLRGGAVNKLRARAYRLSLTAVSTVLLAELLHHHRRGQFIHVLWLFDKFFHVVGVPARDVARRLWKRDHYPLNMRVFPWALPPRITETTFNLPSKLWPTTHHTALVWTALVQLCESEEDVVDLYNQLLERTAQFQQESQQQKQPHIGWHSLHHQDNGFTPVVMSTDRYDAAHFRPFLIARTLLRGAQLGLRVLDDMQDRGITPSVPILGTAAALQARHGEPAVALRILNLLRGQLAHTVASSIPSSSSTSTNAATPRSLNAVADLELARDDKTLLLTAFTGVLRGLVDRRALVQARQLADMISDRLGYVEGDGSGKGGNARTDAALRFLRRLEVEGPSAEPETQEQPALQQGYYYPFLKRPNGEVGPNTLPIFSSHFSPYCLLSSRLSAFSAPPPLPPLLSGASRALPVHSDSHKTLMRRLPVTQVIKTLNAAPGTN